MFVINTESLALVMSPLHVAAVASIGLDETITGVLCKAGNTRWRSYAALVGMSGLAV